MEPAGVGGHPSPTPAFFMASRLLVSAALFGLVAGLGCSPAPAAQPRATERDTAPHYDLPTFELLVLDEVNRLRVTEGRGPVAFDEHLAAIARAHSQDMLDRGYVSHRTPEGVSPGRRAQRAGYAFQDFGENIFRGGLYDTVTHTRQGGRVQTRYVWHTPEALAALIGQMWMESPSHRENMLAEFFDFGGVGTVIGPDFEVLVTLNLSAPP